jgi:hypothetical protein
VERRLGVQIAEKVVLRWGSPSWMVWVLPDEKRPRSFAEAVVGRLEAEGGGGAGLRVEWRLSGVWAILGR